jgi:hypothetical protein
MRRISGNWLFKADTRNEVAGAMGELNTRLVEDGFSSDFDSVCFSLFDISYSGDRYYPGHIVVFFNKSKVIPLEIRRELQDKLKKSTLSFVFEMGIPISLKGVGTEVIPVDIRELIIGSVTLPYIRQDEKFSFIITPEYLHGWHRLQRFGLEYAGIFSRLDIGDKYRVVEVEGTSSRLEKEIKRTYRHLRKFRGNRK